MSRRPPYGALLLILLLLPTPALCAICAAEGCEMETIAEDCPMDQAPDDCCDEMPAMDHGSHAAAMGSADGMPMDHGMPAGHDCAGLDRAGQPTAAEADDCCAAAGRNAQVPASTAPASQVDTILVQPAHRPPDLATGASGVRPAMPPSVAPRALFTLHSVLLI